MQGRSNPGGTVEFDPALFFKRGSQWSSLIKNFRKVNRFHTDMAYRKFKPDCIFTGQEILENDSVLVAAEDGTIEGLISSDEAGQDVQVISGMISPGFINCHCHLELSHLKGVIPQKTGLTGFVFSVVTQRHYREEEIIEAIARAEDEMLANGIVAVGDICNNIFTLDQKEKNRLFYYNFIEISGWLPVVAASRFEKSRSQYDEFHRLSPAQHQSSMVPHAPYSVSDALWQLLSPHFSNKTITIHNQETSSEDELFKTGGGDLVGMYEQLHVSNPFFQPSGKSSLQTNLPHLILAKNIILVHNTFIKEEDLQYCHHHPGPLFFCLCVNANQYIENALPPLELIRQYGSRIVLGTDSLASNRNLSILDEIKTIMHFFPEVPLVEVLQWATLNGAQALELDHILGSFQAGKKPGIILIENSHGKTIHKDSTVRRLL